jgi:hypothetical protein
LSSDGSTRTSTARPGSTCAAERGALARETGGGFVRVWVWVWVWVCVCVCVCACVWVGGWVCVCVCVRVRVCQRERKREREREKREKEREIWGGVAGKADLAVDVDGVGSVVWNEPHRTGLPVERWLTARGARRRGSGAGVCGGRWGDGEGGRARRRGQARRVASLEASRAALAFAAAAGLS